MLKARIIALLVGFLLVHYSGISQNAVKDCNEKTGSSQKLFVFVGELLNAKSVPARQNVNEARFSATYRIIERICGNYAGVDTINFDVIQVSHDSSFKKNKYQLLMLTKDTGQKEDFVLWADLYFDVLQTSDKHWAVCYMSKNQTVYANQNQLKPKKIKFSKSAFFDTKNMTKEDIDITYPENFYNIKKNKAIPLFGNSIAEIFEHEKEGILADGDMYDRREPVLSKADRQIMIQDVELNEVTQEAQDSLHKENEKTYLAIKDSLLKDPFNETVIKLLIRNCRAGASYDHCSQFFEDLIQHYPDSIKAYLLKAKFQHVRATMEDSSIIHVLLQAIKVDSLNYQANYVLGLSYYSFFRQQPNTYYASSARNFFTRCIKIDTAQLAMLRYPIIQLSKYLKDSSTTSIYEGLSSHVSAIPQEVDKTNKNPWYFPIRFFLQDSTKWVNDPNVDIISKLRSVKSTVNSLSETLGWFKEPIISIGNDKKVYRFVWSRSFDAPVIIRLQKINRRVIIYWKMPVYDDSLQTFQTALEVKKSLKLWQWKRFEKSLKSIDYWRMVSGDYHSADADGANWLLEAAIDGKYQVTERSGHIYPKYKKCLRYLIDLTDLNLPEERIY